MEAHVALRRGKLRGELGKVEGAAVVVPLNGVGQPVEGRRRIGELPGNFDAELRMAEDRVVVNGHPAIRGEVAAVGGPDNGVDLQGARFQIPTELEGGQNNAGKGDELRPCGTGPGKDGADPVGVEGSDNRDASANDLVGLVGENLLDSTAADRGKEVGRLRVGIVNEVGEEVLLLNGKGLLHQDVGDRKAAHLPGEEVGEGRCQVRGSIDASNESFGKSAGGPDLRLCENGIAEILREGIRNAQQTPGGHGYAVAGKQLLALVLVESSQRVLLGSAVMKGKDGDASAAVHRSGSAY